MIQDRTSVFPKAFTELAFCLYDVFAVRCGCDLDPIPAVMLKECWPVILPVITNIVNRSLDCAVMPEMLKIVQIRPHLKKANLDDEIFMNFRPV